MLTIANQYPSTVWVSIMWYTPNCPDGGDWTKAGWWRIDPGQAANVLDVDLDEINRYYCYFAHSADGAVWAGPYVRPVPPTAYQWCEWTGVSDSRDVGFRLLDIGDADDFILNLTP